MRHLPAVGLIQSSSFLKQPHKQMSILKFSKKERATPIAVFHWVSVLSPRKIVRACYEKILER